MPILRNVIFIFQIQWRIGFCSPIEPLPLQITSVRACMLVDLIGAAAPQSWWREGNFAL
jgi:hypothetical protein